MISPFRKGPAGIPTGSAYSSFKSLSFISKENAAAWPTIKKYMQELRELEMKNSASKRENDNSLSNNDKQSS